MFTTKSIIWKLMNECRQQRVTSKKYSKVTLIHFKTNTVKLRYSWTLLMFL